MDERERSDRMAELIRRSSLGTEEACAIRSFTRPSDVAEVLASAERLRARGRQRELPPAPGMARRVAGPGGRPPSAAARSGSPSAGRNGRWRLAGIAAVISGLLLMTGNGLLPAVAAGAASAVLVLAARRGAARQRRKGVR